MDGLGIVFHINRNYLILSVEGYGDGLRYLPKPRIQCLGQKISFLFPGEAGQKMYNAAALAFKEGQYEECFTYAFVYTHSNRYMHGKAVYASSDTVMIVLEVGDFVPLGAQTSLPTTHPGH